ncbi:MAG: DNA-3-methyladenine glycosylase 2 family protein, partial [Candidatus Saccharimonadales bacterium]
GRLDVLAVGDFGIKKGIQKLYGYDSLPTAAEIQILATKNNWSPYESVACWYIWKTLDNKPSI